MSDELLPYYNSELRFIRQSGAQFAQEHPKIAGRLGVGTEAAEDPHVARMIEAFAYLNARTRHKLEDDFPEITEAFLGVLYPHYLRPLPSMSIVEFTLDRGQAELVSGHTVEREAAVETEAIDGEPCRFRTCYPATLWPIEIKSATLQGQPFSAPSTSFASNARAVLRIQLQCFSPAVKFRDLKIDRLRFFLNAQPPFNYSLYELLFRNSLGVALANSPGDQAPVELDTTSLCPVGFERDEGLLDYPAHSFLGYRLLAEFFACPEKFLFVDVAIPPGRLQNIGNTLELFIYLNTERQDLEQSVNPETMRLGCTPMVNLYKQRAEPIQLTQTEIEYRVVPDSRRPAAHEVYSIDRVAATSPDKEAVEFHPFYSFKHTREARQQKAFWHSVRRPSVGRAGQADMGTEVFLSLVDLNFRPSAPANWTVDVETTCLNRDLPRRLPFGGGQPRLQQSDGAGLAKIRCLTRPTRTFRPAFKHGTRWRLISHLCLNHVSLVENQDGAEALREILKLYDFADSAETRDMIEGLLDVNSERVVGRVVQRVSGKLSTFLARGLEVTLHFDEDRFSGSGVFLFATVLERFLGLYSSINSFVKTVVTTNKRDGDFYRWPPRTGEKRLL